MKGGALVLFLVLFAASAQASELCSMMGGTCRDACTTDQYAEVGVFEDCREDQECCVQKTPSPAGTKKKAEPGGGTAEENMQPDR